MIMLGGENMNPVVVGVAVVVVVAVIIAVVIFKKKDK